MALQDVGALRPQRSVLEEQCRGKEDLRGVEAFLEWMAGDVNRGIRRIAGLAATEGEVVDVNVLGENEDFLTGRRFHVALAT